MQLVEAASRRLDFEQSRDGSATVPIDFPTGSGNLNLSSPNLKGLNLCCKRLPFFGFFRALQWHITVCIQRGHALGGEF